MKNKKGKKITPSQKKVIIALHEEGLSQGQIAEQAGHSKSSVNHILKKHYGASYKVNERTDKDKWDQTRAASETNVRMTQERRLDLSDKIFAIVTKMIQEPSLNPQDLRAICISYGIAEDKRTQLEPILMATAKSGLEQMREALRPKPKDPEDKPTEVKDALAAVPSGM
jgi:hypothetical protein